MASASIALPALLEGWDLGADASVVSYDLSTPAEPPVWRVALPQDPAAAARRLRLIAATVDAAEQAQGAALDRIGWFVTRSLAADVPAYDVGGGLAGPERELAFAIGLTDMPTGVASFGIGDAIADRWHGAVEVFQEGIARITRLLSGQIRVETLVDGILAGRSVVSLAGDMSTAWRGTPSAAVAELHRASLDGALRSRAAILRTLATAARGAAMLVTVPALLANPAGALLAIPAAWRFVSQVMDAFVTMDRIAGGSNDGE